MKWHEVFVQGVGRCAVWADPSVFAPFIEGEIEVENLTMFVQTAQGVVPIKAAEHAKIKREYVACHFECDQENVAGLSKLWDQSRIETATMRELPRKPKHD